VASPQWLPKLQHTFQDIKYEQFEGIAKITINRPEVRNAFRPETIFELQTAFADVRDQLSEPRNYAAIVEAIAAGFTRITEIATMAGLPHSSVGKYLSVLQHLGIVARMVPAPNNTASAQARSKPIKKRSAGSLPLMTEPAEGFDPSVTTPSIEETKFE